MGGVAERVAAAERATVASQPVNVGKRFLAAGWAWIQGGDFAKALGSALVAYMFYPNAAGHSGRECRRVSGSFRVRIGKRVTTLERRMHRTPSGRCSRGSWQRIDTSATPLTAARWGKLGEFWAWHISEGLTGQLPAYCWTTDASKGFNRSRTPATCSAAHPTLAAGSVGRGRVGRGMPNQRDTLGFTPASGRNAATHDPRRILAAKRAANRKAANAKWLAENSKGSK